MEAGQLLEKDKKPEVVVTEPVRQRKSEKSSLSDVWPQVLVSCISLSSVIQAGINLAFSGILLPQLADDPNIEHFTKAEASWIASLSAFSLPVGSIIAGPLMDRFGRRTLCILQNIPLTASWIIVYFTTTSLWPLYVARLMSGFGGGLTVVGLVYTAEISHVSYRPILLSLNSVNVAFGILITTVVGVYLDWHQCAIVFGLFAFVCLLLTIILPESPYWMATFTDAPLEDIKIVVKYLNRGEKIFTEEWQRIQEAISKRRQLMVEENHDKSWPKQFMDTCRMFKERTAFIPTIILVALFLFQQISGTYVVIFYTLNIFQSIGTDYGYGFDRYSATVALGVIRFIMSFVSTGCSKVMGRRSIMLISSLLMAVSICMSSGFLYLNGIHTIDFSTNPTNTTTHDNPKAVNDWWIIGSILIYVCAGSFGLMVIPWAIVGELLPTKVRAFGSGLIISYGSVLMFIIIKTFPYSIDLVTLPGVFLAYGVMSFVMTAFVYFYLPETLGKSFQEISKYFSKSSDT
ncbi:facilitated trehalose transporter Tret1 [Halyomorpha halys]|uniref:facilitated trehalose transporter Tret1 n=1 Tax=Halyomorpha halys TaxID=286706 RepID=UPI0006D52468|nr:facilitated trehalose transporter Tret1 [Halyomorpha halys]XP_014292452.1 facilitated trehalose transporter Tret1 [Halyomorpha halys]